MGQVGGGCRTRGRHPKTGGLAKEASSGSGAEVHDSGRFVLRSGNGRKLQRVGRRVTFVSVSSITFCEGRLRGKRGTIFKQGVFGGRVLAFTPDVGVPAPTGCHLNTKSKIVVSI